MVWVPSPEIYGCLVKARNGDKEAEKEILRLHRQNRLAREIKPDKPKSNRARRAIELFTAGVTVPEWDYENADGTHTCLLLNRPPAGHEAAINVKRFDD